MADLLKFKLLHGGCSVPGPHGIRHAKAGEVVELSLADATRIEGEDASSQILQPVDSKLLWGPTGPKVATKPAKTAPAAEDDK